jgi:hypothetical protein
MTEPSRPGAHGSRFVTEAACDCSSRSDPESEPIARGDLGDMDPIPA